MRQLGTLTMLTPMTSAAVAGGKVVLTKKFVTGTELYCRHWPGPVRVLLHPSAEASDNLDNVAVSPGDLPFEVELCAYDSPAFGDKLAGSALVFGGPHYRVPNLLKLCKRHNAPAVSIMEYSLRTRLQIARISAPNRFKLLKQTLWELNAERRALQGIAAAAGVQCNGTPTYSLYRHFSEDALLFFDTRTEEHLFATADEMQRRDQRLRAGGPLTLAFSGRLIPMKGAEHILDVAAHLKRRGFPFRFLIAGDGSSAPAMRARIEREGLHEVQMLGVLPFDTGLMPLVRNEVDVFVACHRQGDPSCTYLETLAAGVPIVGYTNEAFAGLLALADLGWGAALNHPERVAELIIGLSREDIIRRSHEGLRFARQHSFEATFRRRTEHIIEIAERWRAKHPQSAVAT